MSGEPTLPENHSPTPGSTVDGGINIGGLLQSFWEETGPALLSQFERWAEPRLRSCIEREVGKRAEEQTQHQQRIEIEQRAEVERLKAELLAANKNDEELLSVIEGYELEVLQLTEELETRPATHSAELVQLVDGLLLAAERRRTAEGERAAEREEELRRKLGDTEKKLKSARDNLSDTKNELRRSHDIQRVTDARIKTHQQDKLDVERLYLERQVEVQTLKAKLVSAFEALQTLQDLLRGAEERIKEQQGGKLEVERLYLERQVEVQTGETALRELQDRVGNEIATLSEQRLAVEVANKVLRADLAQRDRELAAMAAKANSSQTAAEAAVNEANNLKTELKETQTARDNAVGEVNSLRTELESTNTQLEGMNPRLKETNTRLEETNNRFEETNARFEETSIRFEETNTRLEETNTRLKETNAQLEETRTVLNNAVNEANNLGDGIATLGEVLPALLRELEYYESRVEEAKARPQSIGKLAQPQSGSQRSPRRRAPYSHKMEGNRNRRCQRCLEGRWHLG